jgi:predicted RNA methylase
MVKYPFRRVDGVEISPQMARIARENCRRMGISNSEVFVADAADFTLYDPYTFIYLYNPFPARVMEQVLANLVLSVARAPRSVTLIYNNPVCDPLVRECGFVLQREFRNATLPVRVYGLSRTPQPH